MAHFFGLSNYNLKIDTYKKVISKKKFSNLHHSEAGTSLTGIPGQWRSDTQRCPEANYRLDPLINIFTPSNLKI